MTRRDLLAAGSLALWARATPRRLAVLVGVCELAPPQAAGMQLYGTRNDVARLRQLLLDRYAFEPKDIVTVTGLRATRANILSAIEKHLVAQAAESDLVLFYFSGHGVLVPPREGDDPRYRYKALVPYDVAIPPTNPEGGPMPGSCVYNREVVERLDRLKTRRCVVILDACHSGVGARGQALAKNFSAFAPPEPTTKAWRTVETASTERVVLTACRAEELALEGPLLLPAGARPATPEAERAYRMSYLTCHLIETLRRDTEYRLTWEGAWRQTARRLAERLSREGLVDENNRPTQNPEASGSLLLPVFGLTAPPKASTVDRGVALVTRSEGKTLSLSIREGANVPVGAVLAATDAAQAQAVVTSATGVSAAARVASGTFRVGQYLRLTARRFPAPKLRVRLTGAILSAERESRLRALPVITLVEPGAGADVTATRDEADRWQLTWGATTLPEVSGDDALITALTNLAALVRLASLDNPDAKTQLEATINDQPALTLREGDLLTLTARSSADGYLYVLDIDASGSVTLLFPNQYASTNAIKAGVTYELPRPGFRLRARPPLGAGIVKALVTDRPLSLTVFAKAEGRIATLGSSADVARDLLSQLNQDLTIGRGIGVDADDALPVSGWAAATIYVRIL
jgi:hypothetical protein